MSARCRLRTANLTWCCRSTASTPSPIKEAAYRETFRVLKPGGTFCGCFYVSGEHKRTDWMIRHVYEPTKFFTPPYETADSLRKRLQGMYAQVDVSSLKSIAWFICRKAD